MKWSLVIFGLILFVSCDREGVRDKNIGAARSFAEYNLGVVTNDAAWREFKIPKEWVNRKIKSISTTCGCTVVELDKDSPLIEGKLFTIRISLENKPLGIGRQLVTISFDDGFEFSATLTYEYMPAPYMTPKYVILSKSERRGILELQFPGESNIVVKRIRSPEFIKCAVKNDQLAPNKIILDIEYSDSAMKRSEEAIICETSSARRSVFNVPVLVLEN